MYDNFKNVEKLHVRDQWKIIRAVAEETIILHMRNRDCSQLVAKSGAATKNGRVEQSRQAKAEFGCFTGIEAAFRQQQHCQY